MGRVVVVDTVYILLLIVIYQEIWEVFLVFVSVQQL